MCVTLGRWAQIIRDLGVILEPCKVLLSLLNLRGNYRVRLFLTGLDVLMISGFRDDRQAMV